MTKLQFLCLLALEEMTLTELNNKYFNGEGIGYTKRLISGNAKPYPFFSELYCKRFEQKYQDAWVKEEEYRKSFKGW